MLKVLASLLPPVQVSLGLSWCGGDYKHSWHLPQETVRSAGRLLFLSEGNVVREMSLGMRLPPKPNQDMIIKDAVCDRGVWVGVVRWSWIMDLVLVKISLFPSPSLQRAKMENEKTFPSMISLCAGIDRSKLTFIWKARWYSSECLSPSATSIPHSLTVWHWLWHNRCVSLSLWCLYWSHQTIWIQVTFQTQHCESLPICLPRAILCAATGCGSLFHSLLPQLVA